MSIRLFFFSLYSTIAVSIGLWLLLLLNVSPYQAPTWIIFLFYFTIFLFLTCIFAIIAFYLKIWASNREIIYSHIVPTLRQAIIFSLIITGLLFLEQIKVLNLWVACLYTISMLLLEMFFRSKK